MNVKTFLLIIISRLIAGVGMTLGLVSVIYSAWSFFFSHNPCRFLLGFAAVMVFFIGYGLYKFAMTYIYNEWDHYR